ncbi:glycosyltransferase family 4 protein [Streptomyces malaysiensis subsp. malaysiensis]|uniref:glycosyltransferase family 4 protein n=1 Tax=Streptomyces malaysiensis TaxID=92644 RepID=UPI0024C06777|nr:glycosyltransferase family 4 protein [Streptomyces sp. NA07423]WHX22313.1 glycosyltransferase family 4 protein [Streptomyces sp. NA07423]
MKITFLIHNVYGIGGTIRTTLNLAAELADRHEVTVVSMLRHRSYPRFAVDPRVTVVPLVDLRADAADASDPLLHQPAEVFPTAEKRYKQYSRLTDRRAREYLRSCDADVIIGTRPGVNVYLARFAPPRALRIAQEHLTHDTHTKKLRAQLAGQYRDLDAVVTTTEADAAVYRTRMRLPGARILAIPNSVPDPGPLPADGGAHVIAAAGRLVRAKRFDLLIEAFTDIAAKHPDWSLRIYGAGADKDRLQRLIEEQGLGDRAALMGAASPIEDEFAKASIVASASDAESFGMTLVEAMRCGKPVVATDCPLGPAEIINDGVDGRLVPMGDRQALAVALCDLIADEPARHRMGEAARAAAGRFDPAPVAHAYEELFGDLAATRSARAWQRRKARWRGRAGRALRHLRR